MASRTTRAAFPTEPSPDRSISGQTSASEHNSDADLAERHAAAIAIAAARPMGLLERQDSANYQPRPPAMTERQDSAQNLQAMAEEMAELAATGSPTAEGPVSRQDSAHEMAQEPRSHGLQQQVSSRLSEPQGRGFGLDDSALRTDSASGGNPGLPAGASSAQHGAGAGTPIPRSAFGLGQESAGRRLPGGQPGMPGAGLVRDSASEEMVGALAVVGRRDSASEQLSVPSAEPGPSRPLDVPQSSAMRSAPSLEVARALMLDDPTHSPRTASQQLAWSPRDEPLSRQDSALDSLVAARHAVLADLAQSARPSTLAETDSAFTRSGFLLGGNKGAPGRREEQPVLDPLMQARALVQGHFASSSSLPTPLLTGQLLDSLESVPSLEAARLAVLGPSYSGGNQRPSSARQRSQEYRSGRRWQSYGGGRGEFLGAPLDHPLHSDKGKGIASQAASSSGSGYVPSSSTQAAQHASSSLQNGTSRPGVQILGSPDDSLATGLSLSEHKDYVNFMRQVSMEESRRMSSLEAAQRAALFDGFRSSAQASSSNMTAGDAGTHQGALEPIGSGTGSAALQGFGSARTADSGLPDTPMSAAGNQDPRLLQQHWRSGEALSGAAAGGTSRRLSSGYDSAHER